MEKSDSKNSSIPGILARLYWFAFGHALLLFFIISMFDKLTVLKSVFYFLFLGFLIASKYIDIKYFDGTTPEGDKPATMADFKSFFKIVIIVYPIIFFILLFL